MENHAINIIIVVLLIIIIILTDKILKLKYYLSGRLTGTHTLQNLLISGSYITHETDKNEFIQHINTIIEYSFQKQKTTYVTLQEEINMANILIKSYNIINASSLALNITYCNDEIKPKVKVPAFILITLIENACKYGKITTGYIQIDISNGTYNTHKIEISGYELPSSKDIKKQEKDHGIDFVKKRLSFMHDHFHTNIKEEKYIYIQDSKLCILTPQLKS